jgi:inner membrane protein
VDTATQALLGATIGQVGFVERLGRRALWWGALAGTIPDLDVLAVATHGPFGEFLYHRGATHALWFGPVVGPALGYAVWRGYARGVVGRNRAPRQRPAPDPGERARLRSWIALFVLVLFTHPLLDVFTAYGTQLLAPFSPERFALNGVGIIDPFYSGLLIAALAFGRLRRSAPHAGRVAAAIALAVSTAYLIYGLHHNRRAEAEVRRALAAEGIHGAAVRSYPTILQPYLRRVVVRTPDEVRVGLYTALRPGRPVWETFEPPPPHPLIEKLSRTREGAIFIWFAMGEVAARVIERGDVSIVEIDDLRYGLPGAPDQGMWGIRASFDRNGELRGSVKRFARSRPGTVRGTLRALARATVGDFSGLGLPNP